MKSVNDKAASGEQLFEDIPRTPTTVQPATETPSWRVLSALAARENAKSAHVEAPALQKEVGAKHEQQPSSHHSPQPAAHPASQRPPFGFEANRAWKDGSGVVSGSRHSRPSSSTASSQARADLEALFGGKSDATPQQPQGFAQKHLAQHPIAQVKKVHSTAMANALLASGTVTVASPKIPDVIVKRRRITLDGLEGAPDQVATGAPVDGETDAMKSRGVQSEVEQTEQETFAARTFLLSDSQSLSGESAFGVLSGQEEKNPQPFDFDALALTERKDQLPTEVHAVEQDVLNVNMLRDRLETMAPEQAAAWLLATPEQYLKPFSHQVLRLMIQQLLAQIDDEALHALHPVSHWISEPATEISFYSDGRYRRIARKEWPSSLPGQIGAWLSAHKLSSNESTKRSVNAQRINAISLAGIVMASNRLEALEWMLAERLDPLRVAAKLGCAQGMENKGHEIGEISGYAMALLAHANQFFSWCTQWQHLLRERALGRTNEISRALSLAIKTWSAAHGELAQDCAEMTAVLLQLGATLSEWGLLAFAPHGRRDAGPAVAWARFCAQTFGVDRKGAAVQRVIESAKIHAFKLTPVRGEPQPMTPYAQADLDEAVAVFLRAGFDPNLTDALGQTVMARARAGRADRVVSLLFSHAHGEELPLAKPTKHAGLSEEEVDNALMDIFASKNAPSIEATKKFDPPLEVLLEEQEKLRELIVSMKSTAKEIRDLDRWIGRKPRQKIPVAQDHQVA